MHGLVTDMNQGHTIVYVSNQLLECCCVLVIAMFQNYDTSIENLSCCVEMTSDYLKTVTFHFFFFFKAILSRSSSAITFHFFLEAAILTGFKAVICLPVGKGGHSHQAIFFNFCLPTPSKILLHFCNL